MKISQFFGVGAILALSACASPPPPPPAIQGEVIMNKYGQPVGCVEGEYIAGAPYEQQCLPPREDCDPAYDTGSNYDQCHPLYRERDEGDGDNDRGQGDTGGLVY